MKFIHKFIHKLLRIISTQKLPEKQIQKQFFFNLSTLSTTRTTNLYMINTRKRETNKY